MSETAPAKPIPLVDEPSRPFFEGAKRGELMLLRCDACGAWTWPVAPLTRSVRGSCGACYSRELAWTPSSGRGELYSYAIVHRTGDPAFADDVPYNIAVVDLEEGVRMRANLVGCANDELAIGMALEVVFDDVSDEVAIPRFKPRAS